MERKASAPFWLSVEEEATKESTTMRKEPSVPGKTTEDTGAFPVAEPFDAADSLRALSFIW